MNGNKSEPECTSIRSGQAIAKNKENEETGRSLVNKVEELVGERKPAARDVVNQRLGGDKERNKKGRKGKV